jgi:hypothetical protein
MHGNPPKKRSPPRDGENRRLFTTESTESTEERRQRKENRITLIY